MKEWRIFLSGLLNLLELELERQRREELLRQAALEQKDGRGWPLLGRRPLFDVGSGLVALGNLFISAGHWLQVQGPEGS